MSLTGPEHENLLWIFGPLGYPVLMRMFTCLFLLFFVMPLAASPVYAQTHTDQYIERPGIIEFSGQMIVRPLQVTTLNERGVSGSRIKSIRKRARSRLAPHTLEYVWQTDEYIVSLPAGETENSYAAQLLASGDFEYAVPNWICFPTGTIPNDGGYWQQWHHQKLRSSLAWDIETGDAAVIIAIVDGGVETSHVDLAAALVPGYNSADRRPQQLGGSVEDVDGHGTYVAGLAGAIGNNGTHTVGVGWDFSIMPIRYYNSPGGGFLNDILDGARWAVLHGARCVNVSQTGVEFAPVQTTGEFIKKHGGLLIWAAGNDGRDLSWFDWPDVLIVGATNEEDQKPDWSAYGLALDVYAPGADILSTGVQNALAIGSGTSAAAPIASGVAGLIWSVHPNASPSQIERWLTNSCKDLGVRGDDPFWGHGRVDSFRAVSKRNHLTHAEMASD
jgi:thermitase